jgi:hypothetical protein
MEAGEVSVEDDHVIVVDQRAAEPGLTVDGYVDGHSSPPEAAGDGLGQLRVVFDHQDPHRASNLDGPGFVVVSKRSAAAGFGRDTGALPAVAYKQRSQQPRRRAAKETTWPTDELDTR